MEEIIRQLEHTIESFKYAQTDFQRGRVFEAEKILQALRIHDESQCFEKSKECDCGNTEDVKLIPICATCYNPQTGKW